MSARPSHEPSGTLAREQSLDLGVRRAGDPSSSDWHRFETGSVVIGRHTRCSLRLDDPAVSPCSLYVQRLGDRVVVIDLGSLDCGQRTGVLGRSGRWHVDLLPAGAPVQVGPFEIWHAAPSPTPLEESAWPERNPLPTYSAPVAAWEILNVRGEPSGKSRHLRHELTLIGQGPLCRFRMVHETIAEIHASLIFLNGRLHVTDLCSEHGVYVNGHKVFEARLYDGDELRIGQCRGTIRLWPPPRSRTPPETAVQSAETDREVFEPTPEATTMPEPAVADIPDGIEVSLAHGEISVRHQSPPAAEATASSGEDVVAAPASHASVLSLLSQFLEMQQAQLDQTQALVRKMAERLHQTPAATDIEVLLPETRADEAETSLADTDEFVECVRPEEQPSPTDDAEQPNIASVRGRRSPPSIPAPELHTWLTQQLAGLQASRRSGIARLWQRLTGSD